MRSIIEFALIGTVIAQASDNSPWGPLASAGVAGIVLAWFMFRAEKRLDRVADQIQQSSDNTGAKIDNLAHKISGMTKAMLADVLSRPSASDQVKEIAREMLAKAEAENGFTKH